MKKGTLINAPVSGVIATMGHTDVICVADAGLPIPPGVRRIDLAVTPGTPPFNVVLRTILSELEVERVVCAEEIKSANPGILKSIQDQLLGVAIEFVTHDEFKKKSSDAKAVVRSGECSPYANVLLYSGVVF